MLYVLVNVEVYCQRCGAGLCNQTEATAGHYRGEPQFRVEPCEKCLEEARDDAHSDGYDEGFKEGQKE